MLVCLCTLMQCIRFILAKLLLSVKYLIHHLSQPKLVGPTQRRRINTEEKAKVIASVWGTKIIKFLATLAILAEDDFEE